MFVPQVIAAIVASLLGAGLLWPRLAGRLSEKTIFLTGLLADLAAILLLTVSWFVVHQHAAAYVLLLAATACLGAGPASRRRALLRPWGRTTSRRRAADGRLPPGPRAPGVGKHRAHIPEHGVHDPPGGLYRFLLGEQPAFPVERGANEPVVGAHVRDTLRKPRNPTPAAARRLPGKGRTSWPDAT